MFYPFPGSDVKHLWNSRDEKEGNLWADGLQGFHLGAQIKDNSIPWFSGTPYTASILPIPPFSAGIV